MTTEPQPHSDEETEKPQGRESDYKQAVMNDLYNDISSDDEDDDEEEVKLTPSSEDTPS